MSPVLSQSPAPDNAAADIQFSVERPATTIVRSMRLYFWPIIILNTTTMTFAVGGDPRHGASFSIAICLLASFGFLLNDLWDRPVDKVNNSHHFEHSSENTIQIGAAVSMCCLIWGLAIASRSGSIEWRIAWLLSAGLAAYTVVLRRFLLVPTLLAGLLAAAPLWAPLVRWPRDVRPCHWLFVAGVVLLLAARETLMDVRDRRGDEVGERCTMATLFGPVMAKSAACILLVSGAALLGLGVCKQMSALSGLGGFITAVIACVVLCLVLIPAGKAVLPAHKIGEDHMAIQTFVLLSRAAMAALPILNLFLVSNTGS
jgi:4-hydroxybenzoate polyprenyltransferase